MKIFKRILLLLLFLVIAFIVGYFIFTGANV